MIGARKLQYDIMELKRCNHKKCLFTEIYDSF